MTRYRIEQKDIQNKLNNLHTADEEYYSTAEYLLKLANRIPQIFKSSKPEIKRRLIKLTLSNPVLDDVTLCATIRKPFSRWAKGSSRPIWGLLIDTSRVSQPFRVKLLAPFHRRRYGVLQASIGRPLPEIKPRSAPPQNFVREAIRVKEFMDAHPEETCLSAAPKLNLHRKRISKFLTIANHLPANLITELANCNDPKTIRKMTLNRLLTISNVPDTKLKNN